MPARQSLSWENNIPKRNSDRDSNGGIPKESSV